MAARIGKYGGKGGSIPCDGFVAIVGPGGSVLRFSTYLAGMSWSSNFPSTATLTLPKVFLARIGKLCR